MGNRCFKGDSSREAQVVDVFDKDAYVAYYHGAKFRTVPHRGNHYRGGRKNIGSSRNVTADDTSSEIASTNGGSVYTPPAATSISCPSAPLIVKDKVIRADQSPFQLEGPNCPLRTCTDPSTVGSFVVIDVETGMVLVSVVLVGKSVYAVSTPDGRHVTFVKKLSPRKSYIMEDLGYKGTWCEDGQSDRLCITGPSLSSTTCCIVENRSQVIVESSDSNNEGVVDMLVVFLFNAINIIENNK